MIRSGRDSENPAKEWHLDRKFAAKGGVIAAQRQTGGEFAQAVLAVVFDPGRRPDRAAVDRLAAAGGSFPFAISHRPEPDEGWLELLAMGMSYDCRGLVPDEGAALGSPPPDPPALIGLGAVPAGEAIALSPGPHLAEAGGLVPVVRALAGLGAALARLEAARAVCWLPAGTWVEPGYFRRVVESWLGGGAFPALGLCALRPAEPGLWRSHGLAYLIGQELELTADPGIPAADAARIAVRLIDELVAAGPLHAARTLAGPAGERITLRAAPGAGIVHAAIGPERG